MLLYASLITKSAVKLKQHLARPFLKNTPTVYYFKYKCGRKTEDLPLSWCVVRAGESSWCRNDEFKFKSKTENFLLRAAIVSYRKKLLTPND